MLRLWVQIQKFVERQGGEFKIGRSPGGGVTSKIRLPRSASNHEELSLKGEGQLKISLFKLPGQRVVAETCDKRWSREEIRVQFLTEVMTMTTYRVPVWRFSTLVGGMIVLAQNESQGDFDKACQRSYLKEGSPFGRELQGQLGDKLHNQYGQVLSGATLSLQLLIDQLSEESDELREEGEAFIKKIRREAHGARELSHRLYDFLNGKGKCSPLLE